MKMLLILSTILCVALSIRAAIVVPAEAAAIQQENKPAPESGMDADGAVAGRAAALPQARFGFCLDGWQSFRGSCYFLVNQIDTWSNAERHCAGFGGSLASVHDIWEHNFLQRLVKTGGHTLAWIGGYYFEGCWRWEDGSAFDYRNWGSSSSTVRYQCLQLNSQESKGWSNHGCSMRFPSVCQVKSGC